MNLTEMADRIGVSRSFVKHLNGTGMVTVVDPDSITMVECIKYKTEFALSKLQLLDRFASMDTERERLIDDMVIDELDKL